MRRSRRDGLSLVELLVALTLLGVVGGGLASATAAQWRSHDALRHADRAGAAVRDGAGLLLAELRATSPAAGDLAHVADTMIEARATIGAAVACSISLARDRLMIPAPVASGVTWWRDAPVAGDSVEVVDGRGPLADTLVRRQLVALRGGACGAASGFASAPGALELVLSTPLGVTVMVGAPIRFVRGVRYLHYRSATDGRWYLGVREPVAGAWSATQPVVGPLQAAGTRGLEARAFDSAGTALPAATPAAARALALMLRATGPVPARALGRLTTAADSARATLAPRN